MKDAVRPAGVERQDGRLSGTPPGGRRMKSRGVVLSHKRGSGSSAMLREIVVDHGKLSLLPHDQVETARLPQRTIARPGQANVFLPPAEGGVRAAGQARLCGAGGCAPTGFPRGSKGAAFHAPFPAFPVPCARGWYFFQKRTPPLSGRRESKKAHPVSRMRLTPYILPRNTKRRRASSVNRAGSRFFAGQAAEVRSFTSPLVSHGACIALIIAWVFRFVNRRGFFP